MKTLVTIAGAIVMLGAWVIFAGASLPLLAQQKESGTVSLTQDASSCKLPLIRDALAVRVKKDQEARNELIKTANQNGDGPQVNQADLFKKLATIDSENTAWLKKQVEVHGWLGKSLVGKEGAHHAWLLVQHADQHRDFQKQCLKLMTELPTGEVGPVDIAYLTDRILSGDGKPQRYGTQCTIENGKAVVTDVEDREKLNDRRAKLGLEPIEVYLKQIEKVYRISQKSTESPAVPDK